MTATDTPPLVIASCGAAKAAAPCPAGQLYTGSYARLCLRAALAITDPANVRIMSAKWGLLELDAITAPYDTCPNGPDAVTVAQLREQATAAGLLHRRVIVLAGSAYARMLAQVFPDIALPLAGCGIGHQRARLAAIIAGSTL